MDFGLSRNDHVDGVRLFFRPCRSALQSDRAASCVGAQAQRRIACMSRHGGFCLLRISRASREGLPRHLSAAARTGSLHRLMSTIAFRGPVIALGRLSTRAIALKDDRSWTLCRVRTTIQLSHIKGIRSRAGMLLSWKIKTGKCWAREIVHRFRFLETDGSTSRLDNSLRLVSAARCHPGRVIVPWPSGTAKGRKDRILALNPPTLHCSLLSCLQRTLIQATKDECLMELSPPARRILLVVSFSLARFLFI